MDKNSSDIREICQLIADVYKNKMTDAGYDANGALMNFTWTTEMNGTLFLLYFELPDYWKYAEFGVPANSYHKAPPCDKPPFNAIYKWMSFKKLVPSTKGSLVANDYKYINAVRNKIAKNGIKGKHLLLQTIDETYDTLVDLLVDAITAKMTEELEKDIKNI